MIKIELNPYTGPYNPNIDLPGTSRIINTYNQDDNDDNIYIFKECIYAMYKDSHSIFKFSVFEFNLRNEIYVKHDDDDNVSICTQQEFEEDFKIVENPVEHGVGTVLPKSLTITIMMIVLITIMIIFINVL